MTTLETVQSVIARVAHTGKQDTGAGTPLKDISADSLHWVQIIVGLEDEYDIEIDFERMKNMTTVGDLVSYVDGCRG